MLMLVTRMPMSSRVNFQTNWHPLPAVHPRAVLVRTNGKCFALDIHDAIS